MRRRLGWALLSIATSCGTTSRGRRWSDDATLLPSCARLWQATKNAVLDPYTWVPLAGAGVLAVDDWDRHVSDWARDRTPLFHSPKNAADQSETLRDVTRDAWLASVVAAPSGDEPWPWALDKAKGFGVEYAATFVTSRSTSFLKSTTGRERPDGSNESSFPSTTASDSFGFSALARRNLDAIEPPPLLDGALRVGLTATAAAASWARVEAGKHYPTDVLVGASLGNFVALFVHDAFLALPDDVRLTAVADPSGGVWSLGVAWRF
jgi:hypothetical protein